jgi:nitroreductase
MNQVIETILKRRSVRFFRSKTISRPDIEAIINAGNHAPTGSQQSWRFVVAENADFRKKLGDLAMPRYKKWMENAPEPFKTLRSRIDSLLSDPVYYSAPVIIFVIGKSKTADSDCPMVCENMMLAATSLGIGSCWVFFGQIVQDEPSVRAALDLQEGEKIYGPIVFGYAEDKLPERAPKKAPSVKWI